MRSPLCPVLKLTLPLFLNTNFDVGFAINLINTQKINCQAQNKNERGTGKVIDFRDILEVFPVPLHAAQVSSRYPTPPHVMQIRLNFDSNL